MYILCDLVVDIVSSLQILKPKMLLNNQILEKLTFKFRRFVYANFNHEQIP